MPKTKVSLNKPTKFNSKQKSNPNKRQLNENTKIFIKTQILFLILNIVTFLTCIFACLQMDLSRDKIFYVSIACFCLGSFISAFYAGYKIHKNGLAIGFIFTLPINSIVVLISMITNGFEVDSTAMITFLILMSVAMLAGILSVNIKMKAKR